MSLSVRAKTRLALPAALVTALALLAAPVAAAPTVTDLVRDIAPTGGSDPRGLVVAGGLLYFSADDGSTGRELWVSDGTAAGTRLVRDIRPGAAGSGPSRLTRVGSRVWFSADDGSTGRELWLSDGTRQGTHRVRDLTPGAKSSTIRAIVDGGKGKAWVMRGARELWRSDGTRKGTLLMRRFERLDGIGRGGRLGAALLFSADEALWRSGGSAASTRRLALRGRWSMLASTASSATRWSVGELTRFDGRVWFSASTESAMGAQPPRLLFRSDGTSAGTRQVGTLVDPSDMVVHEGRLYFSAVVSPWKAPRLFVSDGSAAGTAPLVPWTWPLWGKASAAGQLWTNKPDPRSGYDEELWVSDGSAAGTRLVVDGEGTWATSDWDGFGLDMASLDGRVWFAAGPIVGSGDDIRVEFEPWMSDGTGEGTRQAATIGIEGGSSPRDFTRLGSRILFSADDGSHGRELWSLSLPM